jgi:hypothetical protein
MANGHPALAARALDPASVPATAADKPERAAASVIERIGDAVEHRLPVAAKLFSEPAAVGEVHGQQSFEGR